MEKLNNSVASQSTNSSVSNKLFAIIKRECIAIDISQLNELSGNILKPGTLIQIKSVSANGVTLFKMRDFTNWLDKYKSTFYKCSKDDYITVTKECWPYLLTMENETRLRFAQSVNKQEYNLDVLKIGRVIRLRAKPGADLKYYEFTVTHNGVVNEKDLGYYIGLQWKNDKIKLNSEPQNFSQGYRFGGKGIVVTADWIMLNLYNENKPIFEPQNRNNVTVNKTTNGIACEVSDNNSNENLMMRQEMEILPKTSQRSFAFNSQSDYAAEQNFPSVYEETNHNWNYPDCMDQNIKHNKHLKCRYQRCQHDANVHLSLCQHSFCKTCVYSLILTQVTDPNRKSINCTVCNSNIIYSDISQFGNDGLLTQFKTKIETNKTDQCSKVCTTKRNCSICSNFRELYIVEVKRDIQEICSYCIQPWFKLQYGVGSSKSATATVPKKSSTSMAKDVKQNYISFPLRLNQKPFQCPRCKQNIDTSCGVVLANCGDSFCLDCISRATLKQSIKHLKPKCPKCQTTISDNEMCMIDSEVYNIFIQNRLQYK